jgi:two-component system sensor histidine kinase BaeS
MRRRIFWGAIAVALVTIIIGGVTAAVLIRDSVERSIRSEFARQANATARIIENEFLEPQNDQDRPRPLSGLGAFLRVVAQIGGHDYVEAVLVGRNGEPVEIQEADRVLFPLVPQDTDLNRQFRFDAEVDGSTVAVIGQPIRVERGGTLVVLIGTELEIIPWGDVVARFAWAFGLGVILAGVLARTVAVRLSRRVAPLQAASEAVAAGDLGVRVEVTGEDEVTAVAHAFNDMAAQLEAARDREREFLVAVGHDLRTPLTTIAGYAEAIEDGRVDDAELGRIAAVLGSESGRLRRLVEDLMLLARLEAREFTLRAEPVDLAAHLTGVVEGFRTRAEAARVALETRLNTVGVVEIDPDRIAQVVGNLLENALRYTPEAGAVRVGLDTVAGGVEISVTDTGPGIDPADVPHIFERLYVTARYRPVRPEGSGLGLSIVHELVTAMGGTVAVDSVPGRGTTLRVAIPG